MMERVTLTNFVSTIFTCERLGALMVTLSRGHLYLFPGPHNRILLDTEPASTDHGAVPLMELLGLLFLVELHFLLELLP